MHSTGDVVVKEPSDHQFHAPSSERVAAAKVYGEVRSRATECDSSTKNIVQLAVSHVPVVVAPALPTTSSLSQIIRRKRRAVLEADKEEDDDVEAGAHSIPRKLQRTHDNGDFMRSCTEDMVIFASERGLNLLSEAKDWFADGTFYVAPHEYTQLYTLHVLLGKSETVPCAYVLLKNKSKEAYTAMLKVLQETNPDRELNPDSISIDFEQAAILAFKETFPDAVIHGCFFHLSQNIWRRIQEAGLQNRYGSDPEFANKARCLAALAFLPTDDIIKGFEQLTNDANFPVELDPIVDYFETNYIGNIGRGRGSRRRRPTFAVSMWSQFERVKNDLPRTTNSLEGWHNALKGVVNKAHPSISALVVKLRLEESTVSNKVERIAAGHPAQRKKKKYQAVDERIKRVVDAYNNDNILPFLRNIAHNIAL